MMSPLLIVLALAATAPPKPRATPTPAPPPVIEGTVKGPDGKPVDKALVLAQAERGGFPFAAAPNPPVSTRTDAAGAFRLEVKGRGAHTVRVEAAGLAPATIDKVQPPARLPVTLVKGGAIEGMVRDGNTGSPLARIVVEAREERRGVSAQWDADAGSARAQSDEQGRFRIEGLAVGLHTVSARTRGFDSGSRGAVRTGSRVDLYLFPGSAVTGTVRDVEGRPIAKAVVRAQGDAMPFRFTASNTAASTDAEGRFEIPGLSTGRYRLVARAPEFAHGTVTDVVVERGADAEADVVLYRGAAVSGRLTGPNETTVPGRVTVHEEDAGPLPLGLDDSLSAEAGADGRFRVERVAPGSHVIAVVAPGYASQRLPVEVGTAGNPVDLGDIPLEAGLAIRGRVRDGAGLPIADAQINGFNRGGMGGGFGNMVSGRGEADGTFVIAGVAPGTYRLTARAQGYGEGTQTVAAGSEGVDFVLDAAGAITGIAVDEAGRAVDSFRVMARPVVEEMGIRMAPRFEMVGDAEGRFTLDNLSPATYLLQVTAPDRADGIVSNVKVASGATVDVGRVRLGAGGIVRGTVADGTGTPILGATVTVRSGGSQSFGPNTGGEAISDTAGAFEVLGVPVGSAIVTGRHPNYAEGRASGVEVDPAKGPAEVRLVLTQGGRVEGSVTRRDGTGVPDVMVQVVPRQPGGGMSFPSDTMRTTGADGRFAVEHLPVGRVNVTLLLGGGGQFQAGPTKEVEIQEGETAVADFASREILVTGRVTRGGAPAANMRVNVRGERNMGMFLSFNASPVPAQPTGPQRGTAVTREDGSYELLVDDAGRYQASALTMDTRVRYPERPVDVPDADTFTLDLNYNGVPVTGIVVDRETEQPIPDVGLSASPKEPERKGTPGGGGGTTGTDGRFVMELEPGDYSLGLHAEGYASESSELTVGAGGASDVRVTLSRGSVISGRLVDDGGRPVGGVFVSAMGTDAGDRPQWGGGAPTLPDGSFQLARLNPGTYTLTAQSSDGRFAMRRGVPPGQKDVTLTLRPGGQVQILVRGPDGAPVEGAHARIAQLDGVKVWIGGGTQTNAQGTTEVNVPAGQVELEVNKDTLQGRTTVAVPAGGSVPAEITLAEKATGTNR